MQLSINEIAAGARHSRLATRQSDFFSSHRLPLACQCRRHIVFAIPTDGNDGHRYISELYELGVRNFVVNAIPPSLHEKNDINWLVVGNTIDALQRIATRDKHFKGHIVGITGSRGKTTLKEWIYQLMEPLSDISRSPRSFNSQIGVPLSMWGDRQGNISGYH